MNEKKGGWVKIHEKMLSNPVVCKDSDHLALWVYLLVKAVWKDTPQVFGGEKIILKPGQYITGRKKISEDLKIHESKVRRILDDFESDQQIERKVTNRATLITLINWGKYQIKEENRPTTDQPPTTKEDYIDSSIINNTTYIVEIKEIVNYLNFCGETSYKSTTQKTQQLIRARINEGVVLEDFKDVIYHKANDFLKPQKHYKQDMSKYYRPETLFGTKFEGYLNDYKQYEDRDNEQEYQKWKEELK